MIVRFLQSLASPSWSYQEGDLAEFPEAEARRLEAAGVVEPAPGIPETATAAPAERAIRPRPISRKRVL